MQEFGQKYCSKRSVTFPAKMRVFSTCKTAIPLVHVPVKVDLNPDALFQLDKQSNQFTHYDETKKRAHRAKRNIKLGHSLKMNAIVLNC